MPNVTYGYGIAVMHDSPLSAADLAKQLAVVLLAVLAEAYLARRESRWPGLLLPMAAFLRALGSILIYGVLPLELMAQLKLTTGALVQMFLQRNLPTLGLLAVYTACRKYRRRKQRRGQELDKMNIDDL